MMKGNPNLIGTVVRDGNLEEAASILDEHAKLRGLTIKEAGRVTNHGVDAVFGRGE